MLAVENHESDDELVDDDWPVDFFDDDDVKDNDCHGSDNDETSRKDPLDVLARNIKALELRDNIKAFRLSGEAVNKSEWSRVGDGKLEVSVAIAEFGGSEVDEVTVNFCGLTQFRHSLARNPMSAFEQVPADPSFLSGTDATAPVGAEEFPRLRKLYGKVHLTELKLENVPLHHPLFPPIADFIEDFKYDRLSLVLGPTYWKCWTNKLIARALKDVVIFGRMTAKQMLAIPRPVTFRSREANWAIQQYLDFDTKDLNFMRPDDYFMRLVFLGHDFVGFNINIHSVNCMKLLVETISASPVPRKMDIRGLRYLTTESYVLYVGATQCNVLPESLEPIPSSPGADIRVFQHLNATIYLIDREGGVTEGRLVVTNYSYQEE